VSALIRYADGLAQLGAVTRLAEYVVLAAAGVALAWLLAFAVTELARRMWRPTARHAAVGPDRLVECGAVRIPAARRAPDDLTV
jgi:hypothetical protein